MSSKIKPYDFSKSLTILSIFVLGLLLYVPSLNYGLSYLDDNVWLIDYHWYLKDFKNVGKIFREPDLITDIFYRPLLYLSVMINAKMGGSLPFIYRLTNLGIHIFNSCLVFFILEAMRYPRKSAGFFAVIFTIHPVLNQALVWIPGRTDSLMAAFVFLSFFSFLKWVESKRWEFQISHILFLVLALLSKESAIALPAACLSYLILIKEHKKGVNNKVQVAALWLAIIGIWLLLRSNILSSSIKVEWAVALESFFKNLPTLLAYIGKIVMPYNLSVLPVLRDINLAAGLASTTCVFVLLVLSKNKNVKVMMFGCIWFLIFLLPSFILSFLQHEYRIYVPLLGFFILVLETDLLKKGEPLYKSGIVIGGVVIAVFFGVSHVNLKHYQNRMTFWKNAVKTSPHSPLAQRNLGAMYFLKGNLSKAEQHFKRALELNPKEFMVHNNLGLIYMQSNLLGKAENEFKMEISNYPRYDNVYYNLGLLYEFKGEGDKAVSAWKKAIQLNLKFVDAYKQLARYYQKQGLQQRADHYIQELQRIGYK